MRRILLVIAYDGTNYHGWQIQPNGITIEEVLNQKLSELLSEPILVIGASRTDSGVHARGNVAVFDTNARMDPTRIANALNQRLPSDIVIRSSYQVEDDFHPRYQDTTKTYEYRIWNEKFMMPTERLYSQFEYLPLDIDRMKRAAAYFVGTHDFQSFCSARAQVKTTTRTIYNFTIEKQGSHIIFRVTGNGFLYNMVRIMAGTLIKIGKGRMEPERVKEILEAKNRQVAGPTAPPCGLTLVSIDYSEKKV